MTAEIAAVATTGAASVKGAVKRASISTGAGFDFLMKMAARESGFDPNAQAKTSSAAGLFQFIEQTWFSTVKKYGGEHGLGAAANAMSGGPKPQAMRRDDGPAPAKFIGRRGMCFGLCPGGRVTTPIAFNQATRQERVFYDSAKANRTCLGACHYCSLSKRLMHSASERGWVQCLSSHRRSHYEALACFRVLDCGQRQLLARCHRPSVRFKNSSTISRIEQNSLADYIFANRIALDASICEVE